MVEANRYGMSGHEWSELEARFGGDKELLRVINWLTNPHVRERVGGRLNRSARRPQVDPSVVVESGQGRPSVRMKEAEFYVLSEAGRMMEVANKGGRGILKR